MDSNLVCLCEKCHNIIHNLKYNNHSVAVRRGQERARSEGKFIGQKGKTLSITMNDGIVHIGRTSELAPIFNRSQRTIEEWANNNISEKTKQRLSIKKIEIIK